MTLTKHRYLNFHYLLPFLINFYDKDSLHLLINFLFLFFLLLIASLFFPKLPLAVFFFFQLPSTARLLETNSSFWFLLLSLSVSALYLKGEERFLIVLNKAYRVPMLLLLSVCSCTSCLTKLKCPTTAKYFFVRSILVHYPSLFSFLHSSIK